MEISAINNLTMTTEVDLTIEGSVGGPYMVEKIVGIYYGKNRQKYYRVKWADSWEPAENLSEDCRGLIDKFWSGTNQDNYGKPISKDNLEVGQKLIKTEEDLYHPPVTSTTQSLSSVSSTNDYKVTTNDGANISSTNRRRTSRNANQNRSPQRNNRKSQRGNQNRNLQPANANQNLNIQAANQNLNIQTANQNLNIQTANQNRNVQETNQIQNSQAVANQTRNPKTANQNRNLKTANQSRRSQAANQRRSNQKSNQNEQTVNQNVQSSPIRKAGRRPTPTLQNIDSTNTRNRENNSGNKANNHKGSVSSTIKNITNILDDQVENICANEDVVVSNDENSAVVAEKVNVPTLPHKTSPMKNKLQSLPPDNSQSNIQYKRAADNLQLQSSSNNNPVPTSIKKQTMSPTNHNTLPSQANRNVANRNSVTSPKNLSTVPRPIRNSITPPVSNRGAVVSPAPNVNCSGMTKVELSDQKASSSTAITSSITAETEESLPETTAHETESKMDVRNETVFVNSQHSTSNKANTPNEQKAALPDTTIIPEDSMRERKLDIRNESIASNTSHELHTEHSTVEKKRQIADTTIIPDDIERESKLQVQNESVMSNTSLCNINIPTNSLHDINTVPIKMASPTSVVPVEATSTIEDDIQDSDYDLDSDTLIDSQESIKNDNYANDMEGDVAHDNYENLDGNEEASNYVVDDDGNTQYMVENVEEQDNYINYNNNMAENADLISDEPIDDERNNYINGADSNYQSQQFPNEEEGYNTMQANFTNEAYNTTQTNFTNQEYNTSRQTNFTNEAYTFSSENQNVVWNEGHNTNPGPNNIVSDGYGTTQNNFTNENYPGEVYSDIVDITEANDEQNNELEMENYDSEVYVNNESQYSEYSESLVEDVIELDDDDDDGDGDDVELIVSIDSPQRRPQSRLPPSLQQSANKSRKQGRVVNVEQRVRRKKQSKAREEAVNDNSNTVSNVVPLVHPRLLLHHSPQASVEEPAAQTPRRQRNGKRGTLASSSVNNVESSPKQRTTPTPSFVTPPRKRQRATTQPSVTTSQSAPTTPRSVSQLTPQSKNRRIFQGENAQNLDNTASSDFSPSRIVLNDRTCTICSHTFANLTLARQHAKQVHANQYGSPSTSATIPSLACTVCKAMFKTNKDLKSHMLLHSNHTLHKCEICFRAFKQRSVLNQHMLIHNEELPYACTICDKRFRQQGHLIGHLGSAHSENNEATYTCPHCCIDFNDEQLFKEHMAEHDAELPFKCNLCQQRFEMKSNLMLHLEGHNEGRQFTCQICKKSFKTKSYYLGHMQMHKIRDDSAASTSAHINDFDNSNVDDNSFADVKNLQ